MADSNSNYKLKIESEFNGAGVNKARTELGKLRNEAAKPIRGGGDALGGFLKLEDRVGIGGGNKLIGPIATAVASALALGSLMKFTGDAISGYKESISKGVKQSDAFALAMMDAGKKLPIFGSILEGISSIGDEWLGKADFARAKVRADQRMASKAEGRAIGEYNGQALNDARWNQNFSRQQAKIDIAIDPTEKQRLEIRLAANRAVVGLMGQIAKVESDSKLLESTKKELIDGLNKSIKSVTQKLVFDLSNVDFKEKAKGLADSIGGFVDKLKKEYETRQAEYESRGKSTDILLGIKADRSTGTAAERLRMTQGALSQAEKLRSIENDPNASAADKAAARNELEGLGGNLRKGLKGAGQYQISAQDYINAATATSSDYTKGGGMAARAKEDAMVQSAQDPSIRTADGIEALVTLVTNYIKARPAQVPVFNS